jgi:hypothetical protein
MKMNDRKSNLYREKDPLVGISIRSAERKGTNIPPEKQRGGAAGLRKPQLLRCLGKAVRNLKE